VDSLKKDEPLKVVRIYTDGICVGSPGPGGCAAILVYGEHRREVSCGYRLTTDMRMKMRALIAGLEVLKYRCCVQVLTDAVWLVGAATGGDPTGGESTDRMDDLDLWERLEQLLGKHDVSFEQTMGEASRRELKRTDQLALLAAKNDVLFDDEGLVAVDEDEKEQEQDDDVGAGPSVGVSGVVAQPEPVLLADDGTVRIMRKGSLINVMMDGAQYTWTGSDWYDSSFVDPPATIVRKLNMALASVLRKEDEKISSIKEMVQRVIEARDALQYDRSEALARRILTIKPKNGTALAVLCATLRARNQPQQALDETEIGAKLSNTALLTSRAAALCDLRRWEEAKRVVGRALAIASSEEAFSVVNRIKAAAPHLY